MRREFLLKATTYKDQDLAGFWASEKLDGTRCIWDGGVSRGVPTTTVPWANVTNPKTGEPKKNIKPTATGLWSRYGNPITAPDWFLNQLPACLLDGELFAGRGNFQLCRSIIAKKVPDDRWSQIRYCVFGSPSFSSLFCTGLVKGPQYVRDFDLDAIRRWFEGRKYSGSLVDFKALAAPVNFYDELQFLMEMVTAECGVVDVIPQAQLPAEDATETAHALMGRFIDLGGEGVVLRADTQVWEPEKVKGLLKLKPCEDDEGTITGFTAGAETNKGSKLLGLIGALVLDYKGQRLELSGLTNAEREFAEGGDTRYAQDHPGADMPPGTQGRHFKVGDTVTFRFAGLTDKGVPKIARYWRKRC